MGLISKSRHPGGRTGSSSEPEGPTMTRRPVVSVFRSLGLLAVLCAGAPLTAAAQTQVCDDSARAAYLNAVNSGASESELETRFGSCRGQITQGVVASSVN